MTPTAPVAPEAELTLSCRDLPIFPLPNVVFLPHTQLPLHVFEPRYRALVQDALDGNRLFAVPRLRPGWEEGYQGAPPVFEVAGVGSIAVHERLKDGRFNLILQGQGRVRILGEQASDRLYRRVQAELLPPARLDGPRLPAALAQVRLHFGELIARVSRSDEPERKLPPEVRALFEPTCDPHLLLDLVAHMVLRDPDERQGFLECDEAQEQAERLIAAMVMIVGGGGTLMDA